jgi:hypothetical protein
MNTHSSLQRHAIAFAERGLAVFPCKRDKAPLTSHGFKDASTDTGRISDWWTKHPEANIGIATGPISNIWVLDIDPRHHGDASLASLVEQHGPLPPSIESYWRRWSAYIFPLAR